MSKSDEMMKSMMASIASQAMGVFLQGKEEQFRLNQEYQELLYSDDEPDERESVDYYKDLERALAILNSENRELKIIVGELQGYKETAPDYKVWYKKAVEEIKSLKAVIELYEEIVTLEQLTAKQKEKELNARTSNSKGVN
jgi:hypothetical protein